MEKLINALLDYAEEKELILPEDRVWAFNRILEVLQLDAADTEEEPPLHAIEVRQQIVHRLLVELYHF